MSQRSSPESTLVLHGMAQTAKTSPEAMRLRERGVHVITPELAVSHADGVLEIGMEERRDRIREALTGDISDIVVVSHAHYPFGEVVEESPELVSYTRRVTLVTPPMRYPVTRYEQLHRVASTALKRIGAATMGFVGQGDKKMTIGFTHDYITDARKIEGDAPERINRLAETLARLGIPRTVIIPGRRDPVGFSRKDGDKISDSAGQALLESDWFVAPDKSHELGGEYGDDVAQLVIYGTEHSTRLQRFYPPSNKSTDQ